jgi:hypothetical protein
VNATGPTGAVGATGTSVTGPTGAAGGGAAVSGNLDVIPKFLSGGGVTDSQLSIAAMPGVIGSGFPLLQAANFRPTSGCILPSFNLDRPAILASGGNWLGHAPAAYLGAFSVRGEVCSGVYPWNTHSTIQTRAGAVSGGYFCSGAGYTWVDHLAVKSGASSDTSCLTVNFYGDGKVGFPNGVSSGQIGQETINDGAGWVDPGVCDGRLTLTSAVPVTTADVTAAGTLYFTPYKGNRVSLYDGTKWVSHSFAEKSLALTVTSGKNYDIWLYNNSGTLTLAQTEWTNNTTRATAIVLQDGVYVKDGATGYRYLGTIRASAANKSEDSAANRFVWNYKNRVPRSMRKYDTSYSYTTAAYRYCNNSAANALFFVRGLNEDMVKATFNPFLYGTAGITIDLGIALDSNTPAAGGRIGGNGGHTIGWSSPVSTYAGYPGLGYHYLAMTEYGGTGLTVYIAEWCGGIVAEVMA